MSASETGSTAAALQVVGGLIGTLIMGLVLSVLITLVLQIQQRRQPE